MTRHGFSWAGDRRGLAAIEFALIAPVLLLMLGGVADFGLVKVGKGQLANGIAQGTQYALQTGSSVSAAAVKSVVQAGAARSGVTPAVTVVITGPACYCTSGQPVVLTLPGTALSPTYTCAGSCPVSGATPGTFVMITASYLYQPLMPLYSQLSTTTVSEAATVRLQ